MKATTKFIALCCRFVKATVGSQTGFITPSRLLPALTAASSQRDVAVTVRLRGSSGAGARPSLLPPPCGAGDRLGFPQTAPPHPATHIPLNASFHLAPSLSGASSVKFLERLQNRFGLGESMVAGEGGGGLFWLSQDAAPPPTQ